MTEETMQQTAKSQPGAAVGFLRRYSLWIAAAVVVLVLPYIFTSGSSISMMSQMGVMVVFALSYNMLLGQGGMLSFGHAVYFGLGGFFTLHAINGVNNGAWSFPLELMPLVGGLGGLAFGIIFGWISTKRAGVTFALISLGIGELVAASAQMFTDFFGGEGGISTNRVTAANEASIFGFNYGPQIDIYYLVVVWAFLATILIYLLTKTPLGRMANAVRDNPERAQFVGYNPRMVRFAQFSLSGFFAGLAGGLFAIMFEILTAENLGAIQSGSVLLMTYIGGIGIFFGPIIGAILITWLQTSLSAFSEAWVLYFGLMFVFMVMYAPFGISGIIMQHYLPYKTGLLKRLLPAYGIAVIPTLILLVGAVSIVEMGYHISTSYLPSRPMDLFWVSVVATNAWSWIIAGAIFVAGVFACRWSYRKVGRAWDDVNETLVERGLA
ncbi:branched-chain amino acid ABC transporter permease [Ectothiorhodospiraceae bacterium WFHF3C12]|nr:branched-chain amino acid ABC transporter permease [Ectothiorhodospiraceae bacterium WFHF3C12]